MTGPAGGVQATLTDGTGVSRLTLPKVAKDLVVDWIKAFVAVWIGSSVDITPSAVQTGLDDPHKVLVAAIAAGLGSIYRWALSQKTGS